MQFIHAKHSHLAKVLFIKKRRGLIMKILNIILNFAVLLISSQTYAGAKSQFLCEAEIVTGHDANNLKTASYSVKTPLKLSSGSQGSISEQVIFVNDEYSIRFKMSGVSRLEASVIENNKRLIDLSSQHKGSAPKVLFQGLPHESLFARPFLITCSEVSPVRE